LEALLHTSPCLTHDGPDHAEGHEAAPQFTLIAPHYDVLMTGVPYRRWVDYVQELLQRLGHRAHRVLDLACGTGRVGFGLARRGCRVVGADISLPMVQVAARSPEARELGVAVCVQDARALGFRRHFDLVVCLYDSLNYILEPKGLRDCCTGVAACLRPGGIFIFDLNTERALKRNLFTQHNLGKGARLTYDWRSSYDRRTKICTVDMHFVWREGDREHAFREVHRQRAYSTREVKSALNAAGLEVVGLYDALRFKRPTWRSTRAYYVARLPS
jgi:SAM-dependent methyltransferase